MTLVQRFMTGSYTITRRARGGYHKGRYVPGPEETVTVSGSMQPMNARELKLPDEGARLRQYYRFFTDAPVLTINPATLGDADKIKINGDSYRAMARTQWQQTDLDYFETVVWREPEQKSDAP